MKRNLKKALTKYSTELLGKFWNKKNTSSYGTVALPAADQAISLRSDSSINPSINDEQSGAKAQGRVRLQSTRMRGETKLQLNADLDASGLNTKEWAIGSLLEAILGKKTTQASSQNASNSITDPTSTKAGLVVTAAGALVGLAGNTIAIKLVNGGSTGSVDLSDTNSPEFVLTYYNDSTVEDVITALAAHADLACVADANGDDATDLFKDLLANAGKVSGQKIYLFGGCETGFQYDNSSAPESDYTVTYNREKVGYTIAGVVYDKLSLELADKAPTVKIEGMGKYCKIVGATTISANVSAANKIYVADDKQFGDVDSDAPQYVDILANDGITVKYSGLKITAKSYDTGYYINVDTNVTCSANDYIAFHEPAYWNPDINPINGLGGTLKIDNEAFTDIKSVKLDYDNNHQMFNNFALQKSMSGFAPSKYVSGKISITMLVRSDKLGIIQKLHGSDVVQVPVQLTLGSVTGEKMTIVMRFVEFKAPDLSDKGEDVQEVTLEGSLVSVPDSTEVPSLVVLTH